MGVAERTLRKWQADGCPGFRKDGWIDLETVRKWRRVRDEENQRKRRSRALDSRHPTASSSSSSSNGTPDKAGTDWADAYRKVKAIEAKHKLDERLGRFVPIEDLDGLLAERAVEFRKDLERLQRTLPARFPTVAAELAEALRAEVRRMLESYSRPDPILKGRKRSKGRHS